MKKDFVHIVESFLAKHKVAAIAVALLAAGLLPVYGPPLFGLNNFHMLIAIRIGIYIILGLGLNLLTGYAGLVSLGHAGFFAIGAYTSALLLMRLEAPFMLALLCGAVLAAASGFLLGLPTLRLSGNYLTIVTLGFGEIIRMVIMNWQSVTNGTLGLSRIPSASIFGQPLTLQNNGLYFLTLALVVLTALACHVIVNSRTGRAFLAIKQDPIAATMMGIRITRFKILAFVLSAFITGIAGSVHASFVGFIDQNTFTFDVSVLILSVVIVGGMGTMRGMFLGAAILIIFPEASRFLMDYRFVVYGLLLIVMMRFRPQGLLGWKSRLPYKMPKALRQSLGV